MKLTKSRMASFVLPVLHLALCVATELNLLDSQPDWFLVFRVDFPASILFLPLGDLPPLAVFGVLGTLWWYLLSRIGIYFVRQSRLASPGAE